MSDSSEISARVKAIGEWAAESDKRIAFVVCAEIADDGINMSHSLVGRADRVAHALYRIAMADGQFMQAIQQADMAINSSAYSMLLCATAGLDKPLPIFHKDD